MTARVDELRAVLDGMDSAISSMIVARIEVGRLVVEAKVVEGGAVEDSDREASILQRLSHSGLPREVVEPVWGALFKEVKRGR